MLQPLPEGVVKQHAGLPFALRILLWETTDPDSDRVCGVVRGRHSDPEHGSAAAALLAHLVTTVCKEAACESQITLDKLFAKLQRGQARFEAAWLAERQH